VQRRITVSGLDFVFNGMGEEYLGRGLAVNPVRRRYEWSFLSWRT
jgi:hypothetical protein